MVLLGQLTTKCNLQYLQVLHSCQADVTEESGACRGNTDIGGDTLIVRRVLVGDRKVLPSNGVRLQNIQDGSKCDGRSKKLLKATLH